MIYTVTLNPALDSTVFVEQLEDRESIKVLQEDRFAGGKGIDVSRVVAQLGGESIALGFLGGFVGKEIEGRLLNEGIACRFIWVKEHTRTNIIIHCKQTGKEIRLNFPGPKISPVELSELVQLCRNLSPKPTLAVISGSLPEGVNPVIYENLVIIFEAQGARVIVDSYGEPLKKALLATPFMIKPNLKELSIAVNSTIAKVDDAIAAAKRLLIYTQIVAVSMGRTGLLGVTRNHGTYFAKPPDIKVVSTVGAGDSAVASMVLSLDQELPIDEVFRRGAAAGTTSTLFPSTATLEIRKFQEILSMTTVERIE